MSKELAEALDIDAASKEVKEHFEELMESTPDIEDKERFEQRVEAARDGEYLPRRVDSWEELWEDVQ